MANIEATYRQLYLDTLPLSKLVALSEKHRGEVIDLGRHTVEKSWELGGVLLAAKDQVDHGDFMPWLADRQISHDIAKRLMRLHSVYPKKLQIAGFDSVSEALKALPAKADPGRIATQRPAPPAATATAGGIIEMVEHKELIAAQREIKGLKADLAKERIEAERVKAELAQALEENRRLKELIALKD